MITFGSFVFSFSSFPSSKQTILQRINKKQLIFLLSTFHFLYQRRKLDQVIQLKECYVAIRELQYPSVT